MLGLYIHIPFCKQKCFYCDFFSVKYSSYLSEKYIDALIKHAGDYKDRKPDTVYIGGGTPSVLSEKQLEKLLNSLRKTIDLSAVSEFTFELNPESVSAEKLKILKQYGVNRLSMGLQTHDNESLKKLGRIHDFNTFLTAFKQAREAGFDNMNLDLMYGIPGQTMEAWLESLKQGLSFGSEHLSLYPLTVEENTVFYQQFVTTDDNLQREMYDKALKVLEEAGYTHYEISNWAKPGKESVHNSNYWRNREYIALGAGAAGYLDRMRYKNTEDVFRYIDLKNENMTVKSDEEYVNDDVYNEESIMLGLRLLNEGVSVDCFKSLQSIKTLHKFLNQQILVNENGRIKLSKDFVFISNTVISEFIK